MLPQDFKKPLYYTGGATSQISNFHCPDKDPEYKIRSEACS